MQQIEFSKIDAFLDWTKRKISVHYAEREVYFHEQEIWWASIGENVGSEENGKNHHFERPVLILKKMSQDLFWAIPVTTTLRKGSWYYTFPFHREKRCLILVQLRVLSSRRLLRRVDRMRDDDFWAVRGRIKGFLDKKAEPPT